MNQDLSIIKLVLDASLVVQIVMVGLLLISLSSWTVIFSKVFGLKKLRQRNDDFEREFWSGRSLHRVLRVARTLADSPAPLAAATAKAARTTAAPHANSSCEPPPSSATTCWPWMASLVPRSIRARRPRIRRSKSSGRRL